MFRLIKESPRQSFLVNGRCEGWQEEYLLLSYKYSLTLWVCLKRGIRLLLFLFYCNKLCGFTACFKHLLRLTIVTFFRQLCLESIMDIGTYKLSNAICHFFRLSNVKPERACRALHWSWEEWGVTAGKPQSPGCWWSGNMLEGICHQSSPFLGSPSHETKGKVERFYCSERRETHEISRREKRVLRVHKQTWAYVGLSSFSLK